MRELFPLHCQSTSEWGVIIRNISYRWNSWTVSNENDLSGVQTHLYNFWLLWEMSEEGHMALVTCCKDLLIRSFNWGNVWNRWSVCTDQLHLDMAWDNDGTLGEIARNWSQMSLTVEMYRTHELRRTPCLFFIDTFILRQFNGLWASFHEWM